jgi:hypothetical protein
MVYKNLHSRYRKQYHAVIKAIDSSKGQEARLKRLVKRKLWLETKISGLEISKKADKPGLLHV